jgi:hypothetical protein
MLLCVSAEPRLRYVLMVIDTPHTSFFDEDPAVAEEIRESIELRAYVIG